MQILQQAPYFLWQPASWLRVTGEDALSFLQGQLTNDLRNVGSGEATYGLWLNQKGRVVADSFVIRGPADEFFLCSYHAPSTVIRERLEAYIIADDVTLSDETDAWRGVTFFTDQPAETWRENLPGGMVFRGRRDATVHWEWVAPAAVCNEVCARLPAEQARSGAEIEHRRILAGIPTVPMDLGEHDLPNEGGLETVAISYTKGCYLGQEVMARLKAMGQVRRRLRRVSGTGAIPALPAPLFAHGRQVGELRTAVAEGDGFAGLAMLTNLHVPTDSALALAPDASATMQIEDLA